MERSDALLLEIVARHADLAEALRPVLEAPPVLLSPAKWTDIGTLLARHHRYGDAARCLRAALRTNPDDPVLAANLGLILEWSGTPEAAIPFLRQAYLRSRDPDHLEALCGVLRAAGRGPEGLDMIHEALARQPAAAPLYANVLACAGDVSADLGDEAGALYLYDTARDLLPACGRAFSGTSVLRLRRRLAAEGQAAPRADAPPAGPAVAISSIGYRGRLADQVRAYLAARGYADHFRLALETPDWVGHYLFELADPPIRRRRPCLRWAGDLSAACRAPAPPHVEVDLFDPGLLEPPGDWPAEGVLTFRPLWTALARTWLDQARHLRGGATVVAVHVRMGDYVTLRGLPDLSRTRDWLAGQWPRLERPVLVVASDDLAAVTQAFAEFAPLTRHDLTPCDPGLEWLQDLLLLSHADAVAVGSRGSFGALAAKLNRKAVAVGWC